MVRPRECLLVNWIAYEFVRAQNYLIYFKFPVAQSYPGKEHLKKNSKSLSLCLPDRMAMAFPLSHCWPVVGSVALKYSHGHEHLLWKGKKEKKKETKRRKRKQHQNHICLHMTGLRNPNWTGYWPNKTKLICLFLAEDSISGPTCL